MGGATLAAVRTSYNRTRVSSSIPRRLIRERKWFLLPLYAVLRTSDLGREAIENSGSWRFADHIYRGRPSGRFLVGTALDALLLRLPAATSFRLRYLFVRREIERRVPAIAASGRSIRILSVPCGIPRDLAEAAAALRRRGGLPEAARFIGLDLDADALAAARDLIEPLGVADLFELTQGDAFEASPYPAPLDIVTCTGLGEFLDDQRLGTLLRIVHGTLAPGGVLLITATGRHRPSAYLLRELAELRARSRGRDELVALLRQAGFGDVRATTDPRGLQTFAVASKLEAAAPP